MYISRSIEPEIKKWMFQGKILIVYGARQTGKSTLVNKILENYEGQSRYFSGDEKGTKRLFEEAEDAVTLKEIVGNEKIIVIDEAQQIDNIGLKLKILIDHYPKIQIIATGSSSFDLANKVSEPLTGRNIQFWLYPLSLRELSSVWSPLEMKTRLESLLIYGMYPAVITAPTLEKKNLILKQLVNDYLYKDMLSLTKIRKRDVLRKFTEAVSLQTGSEASYNELANFLEISKETVMSYLDILEQGFTLFRLPSFSRNLRQEINRSRKIYFTDTGVRNALINNVNPLSIRNDIGALWENLIISEYKKNQYWLANTSPLYFWRTYSQEEIDLVKDEGGKLFAYEIKWQKSKKRPPKNWLASYPTSQWQSITKDNFLDVLL